MVSIFFGFMIIVSIGILLSPVIPDLIPHSSFGVLLLIVLLMLLSLLFFIITLLILKLESKMIPRVIDHIRICFFSYLFVAYSIFTLLPIIKIVINTGVDVPMHGDGPGLGIAFIFVVISGYAIIVNGVTLFLVNKHLIIIPRTKLMILAIAFFVILGVLAFDRDRALFKSPKVTSFPALSPFESTKPPQPIEVEFHQDVPNP